MTIILYDRRLTKCLCLLSKQPRAPSSMNVLVLFLSAAYEREDQNCKTWSAISGPCYVTHLRVYTLFGYFGNFSYKIGLLVSLGNTWISVVLVMDSEQKREMKATCQCLGFKMLITVTWCKAMQVTLKRIAFL